MKTPGHKGTKALRRAASEQRQLGRARSSKSIHRKGGLSRIEPRLSTGHFEQFRNMFGVSAAALHTRNEVGIIQATAANLANAIENFLFLKRPVKGEPFLKQRRNTVGKAERNVACRHGACL